MRIDNMDPNDVQELLDLTFIGAPKHVKGTRPVHSFGTAMRGAFRGSTHAQLYCGAEQFSTEWTPTIVRFSNSSGQDNHEAEPQIRGMAVKLFNHAKWDVPDDVPDDLRTLTEQELLELDTSERMIPKSGAAPIEEVDLICTGLPNFFASTPEPLKDLFKALKPEKVKTPSRWQRLLADLKLNPLPKPAVPVSESAEAAVLKWAKDHRESHAAVVALGLNATQPPPASFGRLSYHAVHAFNLIGKDGSRHVGRFSFEPAQGVQDAEQVKLDDPKSGPYDYLDSRYLRSRLEEGYEYVTSNRNPTLRFTLRMTLADPWDNPNDPTVVWPSNRRQVVMGTLDLTDYWQRDGSAPEFDQVSGAQLDSYRGPPDGETLTFNPGRLPLQHMYPTGDELFKARVAVYHLSQQQRETTCPILSGGYSPSLYELLGIKIVG